MKKFKGKILVVDDDKNVLLAIHDTLASEKYEPYIASSYEQAVGMLKKQKFDLVITDLKMDGNDGIELTKYIKKNHNDTKVLIMTGYSSIESAVQLIKIGADDYIPKPITCEKLLSYVDRIFNEKKINIQDPEKYNDQPYYEYGIIGNSPVMKKIYKTIKEVADLPFTVLISGESGTGKELIAKSIHYTSKRACYPFVPVNCGSIPENLLESELFGCVQGAFTGANKTRDGFFQSANGGTIFLDEIGDAPIAMQGKLLRVLQEKEVYKVGSPKTEKIDVRIIAATNKDLAQAVKNKLFREDLFFRLNVANINMPPLRERGDDIIFLARYFADKISKELNKTRPNFNDELINVLNKYEWPGNIRELENVIHRLIISSGSEEISTKDIPVLSNIDNKKPVLNKTLSENEYEYIMNVLTSVNGNKTKAAKILGTTRQTLLKKLNKK